MENTKKKEMSESIDLILHAFAKMDGVRAQAHNRYKKAGMDAMEDFIDEVKVATAGWEQDDVDLFVDLMEQDGSLNDKQVSALIDTMNIIMLRDLVDDIHTAVCGSDANGKDDAEPEEPDDKCNECYGGCCDCGDCADHEVGVEHTYPWHDVDKVCMLLNLLTLQHVADTDINIPCDETGDDINLKGLIEEAAKQWDALVAELDQMVEL